MVNIPASVYLTPALDEVAKSLKLLGGGQVGVSLPGVPTWGADISVWAQKYIMSAYFKKKYSIIKNILEANLTEFLFNKKNVCGDWQNNSTMSRDEY